MQNAAAEEEISSATAFVVWAQYIGPTIFLSLYNVIFDTSLRSQLHRQAPNVDAKAIIAVGATHFRHIVDSRDLQGVLAAYSNSIDNVFYLAAALAALAALTAWAMSWKKITKEAKHRKSESEECSDATSGIVVNDRSIEDLET